MSRSLAFLMCSVVLAGCTASGDLMKTATPTVPLQFESEPAGAEVKLPSGQTCTTPCALAVPAADLQVTYSLNGYQPQTVAVKLVPPEDPRGASDESGFVDNTPRFDPSPVFAELVKATPARRAPAKKRAAKQAATPRAEQPADTAPVQSEAAASPVRQPAASAWPAPAAASAWPAPAAQ
jgi:hypothetical protein